MARALKLAIKTPLELDTHRTARYKRFVASCIYLAVIARNTEIALPQDKLAIVHGTRQATVSGWIKRAIEDGYLRKTGNHRFNQNNPRNNRASTYAVDPQNWPELPWKDEDTENGFDGD